MLTYMSRSFDDDERAYSFWRKSIGHLNRIEVHVQIDDKITKVRTSVGPISSISYTIWISIIKISHFLLIPIQHLPAGITLSYQPNLILICDGYLKLKEFLFTQVINWVNTILNHVDTRTILSMFEGSCTL